MDPLLPQNEERFELNDDWFEATKIRAQLNRGKRIYDDFLNRYENIEEFIESVEKISKEEIILGYSKADNYDKKYAVKARLNIITEQAGEIGVEPKRILIVAPPGWGKTVQSANIAYDYFYSKFQIPNIDFDLASNAEDYMHKYPITKITDAVHADIITKHLAQYGEKPEGYNIIVYKPQYESKFKEEGVDKDYRFTLSDFKELRYYSLSDAKGFLTSMLGLSDKLSADAVASEIINNNQIETFEQGIKEIMRTNTKEEKEEGISDNEYRQISQAFIRYLKTNIKEGALANYSAPEQNLLQDMRDCAGVVWRSKSTTQEEETIATSKNQIGLNTILTKTLNERVRYVNGTAEEKRRSKLNSPYGILTRFPEIDKLIPAKGRSYTRGLIKSLGLKQRKNGVHIIGDTQDLSLVDNEFINSANLLIVGRVEEKEGKNGTADALRRIGISDSMIEELKNLPTKYNELGFKVGKMALINRETKRAIYFYPEIGKSAFKKP